MPSKYEMTPEDRDLMVRTIIGEAANQPEEGQAAVAHVIMNRLRSGRHGSSPSQVVLAKNQFEPWSTRARELLSISPQSPQYRRTAALLDRVTGGDYEDPTDGATHFLEENIVRQRRGGTLPQWARGEGMKIGGHTFYAPEGRARGAPRAASYAPEATPIARLPDELTDAPSAGERVRVAQRGPASPDDLAETLRQAGIAAPGATPASRSQASLDRDLEETLRQAGISMSRGATGVVPKSAPLPEPKPGKLGPQGQIMAEERASAMGPMSAVAEGVPVIGPTFARGAPAAMGAAFPSTGSMPGDTFMQRFAGNTSVMDEAARLYAERNPKMSLAGDLIGSTALTGLGAMTAPGRLALGLDNPFVKGLPAKVYSGTIGGGGLGGLDALLRSDNPISGGVIGAASGAAGPIIGSAVQGVVNTASRARPGSLPGLNAVARDKLLGAMEGETPASILAARERIGPSGFAGDLNTGMTDLTGGLADIPGPQKQVVREAYRQRNLGQRGRIDDALTTTIGPHTDIEAFKKFTTEARKAAADPLYEQWRSTEVHPTDELKALIPRLEEAGAFKLAQESAGIRGVPMDKAFFTAGDTKRFPTTESWDLVKRGLDRRIEQAYGANEKSHAKDLIDLKHDLIREIEKTDAGKIWKQARQEFASRSALLDQIDAGRDTFLGGRAGTSVDELRHELKGLGGPELAARLQGLRAAADEVIGDTLRGDTTLRNKMLAPNNQEKIRLMLHNRPGAADRLIQSMEREKFLREQSDNIIGGSQTTPKKERVNALQPPPPGPWNPNLTAPATWLPPSWMPSGVAADARAQRYGNAVNQLAPIVTTPEGPELDRLLAAISAEGRRRSRVESGAGAAGNLLSGIIAGPGASTARRQYFPTQ